MTVKSSLVAAAVAVLARHQAQADFVGATGVADANINQHGGGSEVVPPPISGGIDVTPDEFFRHGNDNNVNGNAFEEDDDESLGGRDDDMDDDDLDIDDDDDADSEFAELVKNHGVGRNRQAALDQLLDNPEFADALGQQQQRPGSAAESFQRRREEDAARIKSRAAPRLEQLRPVQYVKPTGGPEVHFLEPFETDVVNSDWVPASDAKYEAGQFLLKSRTEPEAIVGDKGLRVMSESQFHGISRSLNTNEFTSNDGKELALSYEVRFEEKLECGGGYLKLFSTHQPERPVTTTVPEQGDGTTTGTTTTIVPARTIALNEFNNDSLYSIMFGPDKCGATSKVHFIIQERNPVTGKWVEHHLVDPPSVPSDLLTHQYGFVISPDNAFEVLLDGLVVRSGSMQEEFSPPFTPDREISDPEDKTPPEDYEHNPQIPDPNAVKPEDWDEEAPATIPDPTATMPDDWLPNEPRTIPDPAASRPAEWDEEEDGEWSAPRIANPACRGVSGCGPWTAPLVPNPNYKGKWTAPLIANPNYKGPWSPRKIPNPEFYESEHPHAVAGFDSLGIEIWTVQPGALFDNIVLARSKPSIMEIINETWAVRSKFEREFTRIMDEAARQVESERDAAEVESLSFVQRTLVKTVRFVQLSTASFAALSNERPVLALLATTAAGLLTIFGFTRLLRRRSRRSRSASPKPTAAADAPPAASPAEGLTAPSPAASAANADTDTSTQGKKSSTDEGGASSSSDNSKPAAKTAAEPKVRSRKPAVE